MLTLTNVIDTSVLIVNPNLFFEKENVKFVVPFVVVEELDKRKVTPDLVGKNARKAIRNLHEISKMGSLYTGVEIDNGCVVCVDSGSISLGLDLDINDNEILSVAIKREDIGEKVVLVTNDLNLSLKASAYNIESELYLSGEESLYTGTSLQLVDPNLIEELYLHGSIDGHKQFYANQYICLQDINGSSKSALARYDLQRDKIVLIRSKSGKIWGDVDLKNREQTFAADALLNDNIPLVTMTGLSGSGKTFLALAAAFQKVFEESRYERIFVIRPTIHSNIGFLPGSKDEKLIHWIAGVTDNSEVLLGNKDAFHLYKDNGVIELESIEYLRGRSLNNTFIIIDEAQNLPPDEAKTIVTRAGVNTKIVMVGDVTQIDRRNLDLTNNGLFYIVDSFKKYDLAAHVHMIHGVRSPLSDLAARIL